jgi:hypothetical protein
MLSPWHCVTVYAERGGTTVCIHDAELHGDRLVDDLYPFRSLRTARVALAAAQRAWRDWNDTMPDVPDSWDIPF